MKIEKINENQIRCFITGDELRERNIKLSELTYGSEKARKLFSDMMQEASFELGFDAEGMPLMVEAIPASSGSITLVITKVDNPEELDSRFAKFTKSDDSTGSDDSAVFSKADEILDLFNRILNAEKQKEDRSGASAAGPGAQAVSAGHAVTAGSKASAKAPKPSGHPDISAKFTFDNIDMVIDAAKSLNHFYSGKNALYRRGGKYFLIVHQSGSSAENFNKVCNILSEYGHAERNSAPGEAFLREHDEAVIKSSALQKLASL